MTEDTRCCGSGTCIIDAQGRCWCGQQWDGQTMCRPPLAGAAAPEPAARRAAEGPAGGGDDQAA
jgi:hypothetical protein